jgi:hypothetical protein
MIWNRSHRRIALENYKKVDDSPRRNTSEQLCLCRRRCDSWRPGLEELFFAIQQRIDVVGSKLNTVPVSDGVRGASFDAIAAKNAARIVDVVDLRVALAGGNAIRVGIFGGFDVDAVRGTGSGAQKTAHALFITMFVALQNVNAAVTRLNAGGNFRKIFGRRGAEHRPQRDAEALEECYECFADFLDQRGHRPVL